MPKGNVHTSNKKGHNGIVQQHLLSISTPSRIPAVKMMSWLGAWYRTAHTVPDDVAREAHTSVSSSSLPGGDGLLLPPPARQSHGSCTLTYE